MTKAPGAPAAGVGPLEALRLRLRVPVFTAACVSLGVGAHSVAGGSPPDTAMVLLLVGAVALICASLERRERSLPSIVAGVGLVQLGIHIALLARHQHEASAAPENLPVMLMAHGCGVMALAWWLRRGEAAVWRATATVWRRLVLAPCAGVSSKLRLTDRPAPLWWALFCGAPGLVVPVRGPPMFDLVSSSRTHPPVVSLRGVPC
jgi:hypothetical protein